MVIKVTQTPLISAISNHFLLIFFSGSLTVAADLFVATASYNTWLRFMGLFWVDPLVENKPVYATARSLWIEFWSSMRKFPDPARDKKKDLKDESPIVYKKDKVCLKRRLFM